MTRPPGKSGAPGWRWDGSERPPFAEAPGEGQESVWDYPRPPRLVPDGRPVVVVVGRTAVAETTRALRMLETASPPTFYIPKSDIRMELLRPARGESHCEWKGRAEYWSVRTPEGDVAEAAVWGYPEPLPPFEALRDHLSFYPSKVDCHVDGELVRPQPGGFYGGWITPELVGPFKGGAGSAGW